MLLNYSLCVILVQNVVSFAYIANELRISDDTYYGPQSYVIFICVYLKHPILRIGALDSTTHCNEGKNVASVP